MTDLINIEVREYIIQGKYCGFVENADHVSLYSSDLNGFWGCFGRGKNEQELAGSQPGVTANVPKNWLLQYAPFGSEVLVRNLISGTCHTIANRILLIATEDKDVKTSGGDIVTVIAFGKYGIGLQDLKNKLKESFEKSASTYAPEMLEQALSKLDSLHYELDAWLELIHSQIEAHHDDLKQYDGFIENLKAVPKENYEKYLKAYVEKREEIYNKHNLQNNWDTNQINEYRKELANACKDSIIEAIISEMKPEHGDIVRSVLDNKIKQVIQSYLKI